MVLGLGLLSRGALAIGRAALPGLKIGLTGLGFAAAGVGAGLGVREALGGVGAGLFGGKTGPITEGIGGLFGQTEAGGGQQAGAGGAGGQVVTTPAGETIILFTGPQPGTTAAAPEGLFPAAGKALGDIGGILVPVLIIGVGLFILLKVTKVIK